MKKAIIIILVVLAVYLVIAFTAKGMKKNKYLQYLHSLGFGIADKMNIQELEDSYNYLYNYARKYASNAAQIVLTTNPALYARLQRIVSKYGALFNLSTNVDTNIPNIITPTGVTPIVPDVKLPTASNPANNPNIII